MRWPAPSGRRRRSERSGTLFRPAPFGTFRGNGQLRSRCWERCFRNPNTPRLDVLNGTIDMPLVLECGTFPKSVARIEHGERPMKRLPT